MLERAWLELIVLSLTATVLAYLAPMLPPVVARGGGLVLLLIAGIKADVILSRYLELERAPRIRHGFRLGIAGFVLIAGGLYLAG
ncbi:MAG: cytochrome C oxidase subunit IV family protein [Paracoccus sp. (in: a-proteobacteria)]|nr:cytochrome C oxidase subunit IV family protein [Paracoccus sp. (in: a-proteobacteria)]